MNGCNWLDLVALIPGARGNPGTVRAGFAGGDMAKYQVDGNRMVHEVRAGFSEIDNQLVSNSKLPLHTFPSIVIGSPTNSPQWWKEFNVQANNSLSYFVPSWHGEHSLKTGLQFFQPH